MRTRASSASRSPLFRRATRRFAFPLFVGKAWAADYVYSSGDWSAKDRREAKVVAFERVETAASPFDAFSVESTIAWSGVAAESDAGRARETSWYAPSVGRIVKQRFVDYPNNKNSAPECDSLRASPLFGFASKRAVSCARQTKNINAMKHRIKPLVAIALIAFALVAGFSKKAPDAAANATSSESSARKPGPTDWDAAAGKAAIAADNGSKKSYVCVFVFPDVGQRGTNVRTEDKPQLGNEESLAQ